MTSTSRRTGIVDNGQRHAEVGQDGVDGQPTPEEEEERAYESKAQPFGDGPLPPQVGCREQVPRKEKHEPEDERGP